MTGMDTTPGHWLTWPAVGLMATLGLAACGGSGGDDTAASDEETGQVQVALTDAEGDFLRYEVDVSGLRLERATGATVNVLPTTTRIDFADYVEVSEPLTTQTVPSGTYVGAEITLDYSDAAITVQADDGGAIPADVQDADGRPVEELTVDLALNGDSRFVVAPGVPAYVELDFDLDASNEIEIAGNEATVTVTPTLVATTSVDDDEALRLRGHLVDVDEAASRFAIELTPFRLRRQRVGDEVPVNVDSDTVYEIDGEMFSGEAGLARLAALADDAGVIAYGRFPGDGSGYMAEEVLAGSSVRSGEQDVVRGNVAARDGDTITVRGASVETDDVRFFFRDTVEVELGAGTTVTRRGDPDGTYGLQDVSIGQAVTILGELGDDRVLDATEGLVRQRNTRVVGRVASAGPLAVDVTRINGRRASIFDFAGTGSDASTDADPDNYEIATGTLSLTGLEFDDPVRVRGFVRAYGAAPEDFDATSVIDVSERRAFLVVGYGAGGSTAAVASIDGSGLQLHLAEAGERQALVQAGIATDLASLPGAPFIQPFGDSDGVFALAQSGRVAVYTDFEAFRSALADELDAGEAVYSVHARGDYDEGGNTLTTRNLRVRLAP